MNKYCKKQLSSQISSGATLYLLCNLLLVLMNTSCEISRNLKGCYPSGCLRLPGARIPSVKTQIAIDAHGYDGFAALACIEEGLLNFSEVFCERKLYGLISHYFESKQCYMIIYYHLCCFSLQAL